MCAYNCMCIYKLKYNMKENNKKYSEVHMRSIKTLSSIAVMDLTLVTMRRFF